MPPLIALLLLLLLNYTTEVIRRELLGQRVFVFLKDGKILNLNRGAAVIDAAFQIHTEVGLDMVRSLVQYTYTLTLCYVHVQSGIMLQCACATPIAAYSSMHLLA
jgi:TGS domain